jgi:hypothetical protein
LLSRRGSSGAEARSSKLVQRFQEPLQLPLTEIGGVVRTKKGAIAEGLVAAGPLKSGGAETDSSALVKRSQKTLQLPLTESGGVVLTKRHHRQRLCSSRTAERRRRGD